MRAGIRMCVFYEWILLEVVEMLTCHASYHHYASVHVWRPLLSRKLPYALTRGFQLAIEHTVFHWFMSIFPRKPSFYCFAMTVDLNVNCLVSQPNECRKHLHTHQSPIITACIEVVRAQISAVLCMWASSPTLFCTGSRGCERVTGKDSNRTWQRKDYLVHSDSLASLFHTWLSSGTRC